MSRLSDKAIDELREGKWELHCLTMEITRTDGTRHYSGSGSLKQDANGKLSFTLYDTGYVLQAKTINDDIDHNGLKAGQFFPRNYYFTLRATDTWNNVWSSTPTLDVNIDSAAEKGAVVTGTVSELVGTDDEDNCIMRPWCNFTFFQDIGKFPCNQTIQKETKIANKVRSQSWSLSVAEFETCGFHFELSTLSDRSVLFAHQKESGALLPTNIDVRIIEALQFVLGKPLHWQLLQIAMSNSKITRIRSALRERSPSACPPIELCAGEHLESVWSLFGKYLAFIFSCRDETWHPLSSRLFTIQHSSTYLWNVQMLTLGVEVEGLLNDEYPAKVQSPSNIATALDAVSVFLEQAAKGTPPSVDSGSCNRIKSSLGYLKGSSATNKLKQLVIQGAVRQEDVQAWEHVRHKSAHAQRGETAMTQENSQRLERVLVLFYHLIFNKIGYSGNYTDYGHFGFPVTRYPS